MCRAEHTAQSQAALPVIDMRRGLLLAGSDRALYRAFLLEYPRDDTLPRLFAALSAENVPEAALLAHTLKGLSAQLGMSELSEAARALEAALKTGAAIPACARRVHAAHERVLLAIGRLGGISGAPPAF